VPPGLTLGEFSTKPLWEFQI